MVFAVAVKVIVPSPLPFAGERVSHVALLVTVQVVLEVTLISVDPPLEGKLKDVGSTVAPQGVELPSIIFSKACHPLACL